MKTELASFSFAPCVAESESSGPGTADQPVTAGIALPKGRLPTRAPVGLVAPDGTPRPIQTAPLMDWPDGSVKWLRCDFVLQASDDPEGSWRLELGGAPEQLPRPPTAITADAQGFAAEGARWPLSPDGFPLDGWMELVDAGSLPHRPTGVTRTVETSGPIRATICCDGELDGLRLRTRTTRWAGLPLWRVEVILHNPRAAQHDGGCWDLGDPGSALLLDASVRFPVPAGGEREWRFDTHEPFAASRWGLIKIFQASSGGEQWTCHNHVNRHGIVPLAFRGWRACIDGDSSDGWRATPEIRFSAGSSRLALHAALPEFWQSFPKVLQAEPTSIRFGLWPAEHGDLHELQGGERKRHVLWLADGDTSLDFVHRPARPLQRPQAYADSGALGRLGLPEFDDPRLAKQVGTILDPTDGLAAKREVIDEFGWRNYGDLYGDHEAAKHAGSEPLVSHYNNQYDALEGMLLQLARTGDRRWWSLADPLARHFMDIDLYHTDEDRAAYNRGHFWHTDHYFDAHTATHRCYSIQNAGERGKAYGGGLSDEQNYPSGVLLYHLLTGDPEAAAAVIHLADWVVAMDDGNTTILGLIDSSPTGYASQSVFVDYHGPGRGAGNSVNACCDAFRLTGERRYLDFAETLIRRCVHPDQEMDELNLLDAEYRWSYTIFLKYLIKYIDLKEELSEWDEAHAYARQTLIRFVEWMVANEQPSTTHADRLEHVTETWPAQDLRKASVVEQAALFAPAERWAPLHRWARQTTEQAMDELLTYPTAKRCRPLVLAIHPAISRAYARAHPDPADGPSSPRDVQPEAHTFPPPEPFASQRQRVKRALLSPRGIVMAARIAIRPATWQWLRKRWR